MESNIQSGNGDQVPHYVYDRFGNKWTTTSHEYTVTSQHYSSGFTGMVWCCPIDNYFSGWMVFETGMYSESLPATSEAVSWCNGVRIHKYWGPILSGQMG